MFGCVLAVPVIPPEVVPHRLDYEFNPGDWQALSSEINRPVEREAALGTDRDILDLSRQVSGGADKE